MEIAGCPHSQTLCVLLFNHCFIYLERWRKYSGLHNGFPFYESMKVDLICFYMYPYFYVSIFLCIHKKNPNPVYLTRNQQWCQFVFYTLYFIKWTQHPLKILLKQSFQLGDPCCSWLVMFKTAITVFKTVINWIYFRVALRPKSQILAHYQEISQGCQPGA